MYTCVTCRHIKNTRQSGLPVTAPAIPRGDVEAVVTATNMKDCEAKQNVHGQNKDSPSTEKSMAVVGESYKKVVWDEEDPVYVFIPPPSDAQVCTFQVCVVSISYCV